MSTADPSLIGSERERRFAALLSLGVSIALMLLKFWAHNITDSQAIFSDAVESIINVVTAGLVISVIHYAAKPKDQDHPYGHGKVEYFSAAFEGGLIAFAAVLILIEAGKALYYGHSPKELGVGILMVLFAGIINLLLGIFLVRLGKKEGSAALRASGRHVISDFWTSFGIILGLVLVELFDWPLLDPLAAIVVGFWLGITGLKLVRESLGGLMDEEDLETLSTLKNVLGESLIPGIIQVHYVRMIRSGAYHHIDAHVVLPEFWSVSELHDRVNEFEKNVMKSYPFGGEMNFHFDPCRRAYCSACDLEDCSIRKEEFQKRIPISLEQLRSPDEPAEFIK